MHLYNQERLEVYQMPREIRFIFGGGDLKRKGSGLGTYSMVFLSSKADNLREHLTIPYSKGQVLKYKGGSLSEAEPIIISLSY